MLKSLNSILSETTFFSVSKGWPMRKSASRIIYSASDIVNFLECEHISTLDRINLENPFPEQAIDPQLELLQAKGTGHETAYLESLLQKGLSIADLKDLHGSVMDKTQATLEAMKSGHDVIYQATLLNDNFYGHPDFLMRVDTPSRLGPYSYEALDTKLARHPKAYFVIQIGFYSELLRLAQGHQPRMMHIVLGDRTEASFRFDSFRQYFITLQERFRLCMESYGRTMTEPEKNDHCSICKWKAICEDQWIAADHLNQVAGITKIQIRKLRSFGINTLEQLALHDERVPIPKVSDETLSRIHNQARLQLQKRQTGDNYCEVLPLDPDGVRGFFRLPRPDSGDIFFDMEGDPLYVGGLEYLFGVYFLENGKPQFKAFWAHNRDEERQAFEDFMDFAVGRLRQYPDAHIYHYASYEESALKRLMTSHGVRESQVDELLRQHKLVDLYKVVREGIRVSEPSYSIKNIEAFYAEKRQEEVSNALASVVYYEKWIETGEQKLLDEIEEYNMVDCRSTYQLREWLLKLKPPEVPWKQGVNDASGKKKKPKSDKTIQIEKELESYRKALLGDPSLDGNELEFRELVFYLLDFHRREHKPSWWAAFNRQTLTDDQLIEDPECIGGMTRVGLSGKAVYGVHGGVFYEYPDQEFKLKAGDGAVEIRPDQVRQNLEIFSIDEDKRLVEVGFTRGETPPQKMSMSVGNVVPAGALTKAIYGFADSVIQGRKDYSAVESILRRSVPKISFHEIGQPIAGGASDNMQTIIEAVANLNDSSLFIQGPPGTGKTYTGSHIIVELVSRGYLVGVSSNSHKAINNLLSAVEKTAISKKIRFRGLKKSTEDPATQFNGRLIHDVMDNQEILNSKADLVAGTAWLFARMNKVLDFLFVDEAGQVSLANLVAMGLSARNIVLLGDQMQLGQPIQGSHPGRSGESTLEYLLDGAATITPERGIFLDTTWRMHRDLCGFISEAVYDSRLKAQAMNQNQALLLNRSAHPCLKPTGLSFVPVDHEACSQRSEEEAQLINEIIESLLKQRYRDRDGQEHPLTLQNIMIVAPYNMQVNLLKRLLPKGSRVGTVDKFQGQESEVVIVSMTTSSGDYLPRRIEFLYSKNRLNVAISRARTISILVVNPQLLSINCNTIEQMELVNTLCWAKGYGG